MTRAHLIENTPYQPTPGKPALRKLWVSIGGSEEEAAFLAEPGAEVLQPDDEIQFEGAKIFARGHQFSMIGSPWDPRGKG